MISSIVLATLVVSAPEPSFWQHWGDGKAELNGYALTQPRYGQKRTGSVVLVYVTEDFSETARVKADPGQHPKSDVFPVFKLNAVKDFQTGIYDYNLMTSVFAQVGARKNMRAGQPTKIVFSVQEWCGALFEHLLFDPGKIRQKRFSYFDGEGDQVRELELPGGGLTVEELPILVRGLPTPYLARGEKKSVKILGSLERARLTHRDLEWTNGSLERGKNSQTMSVPAGQFEVETWTAHVGPDTFTYYVEAKHPRRLVAWEGPDGERAELTGSERMPYWNLNREGHEKALDKLGLRPASMR